MNLNWAREIVEQLVKQGVEKIYLAPGSRSTPLALAASEEAGVDTEGHYDERGVAFLALGYAKASGKPAALISTSGSALANLLPAVMEAHLSRVPLILLTADRPPELRDTSANQTTDQVKLFGSYVRWQFDLPTPSAELPARFLATTLGQAVYRARAAPAGPVHLNCMFREPFFTEEPPHLPQTACLYEESSATLPAGRLAYWAERLSQVERGLLIAGSLPHHQPPTPLLELAGRLGWPLFADIDSGIRSYGRHPALIPYHDLMLNGGECGQPEAILHVGDRLVSKSLMLWLEKLSCPLYCLVADHPWRVDPYHLVTHRLSIDPLHFAHALLEQLPQNPSQSSSWLSRWQARAKEVAERIPPSKEEITELGIIPWILSRIPAEWALFFGNSMPVRDAETLFYPERRCGPLFTSRGASGIDGNIATAAGLSEGSRRPLLALLGDQTALHDLNSLPLLKKSKQPILLLIVNNGGGGIFSFLPVLHHFPRFEEFMAGAHAHTFEQAAAQFDLPYYRPLSWLELSDVPLTSSCVVELSTDRARNVVLHREMVQRCTFIER